VIKELCVQNYYIPMQSVIDILLRWQVICHAEDSSLLGCYG